MMKHPIWLGVVAATLLSGVLMNPVLAQGAIEPSPVPFFFSPLSNLGSGLCLQPQTEAPLNGITIVQQPCSIGTDWYQNWRWDLMGEVSYGHPGTYRLVNVGSGQCLDDRDGKTADWSPVQQWTCNTTSTTMQWKAETVGIDPYDPHPTWAQFINIRSGKCLDVRSGSSAPGAVLQIYHCSSKGTVRSGQANLAQVFQWFCGGFNQFPCGGISQYVVRNPSGSSRTIVVHKP
jgi:Ricin-type beta-trefoil lectin domain-like